jgi:hypothetical protein
VTRYPNKKISAQIQLFNLKQRNPAGSGKITPGGRLTWKWTVQPTPVSRIYQARLECDGNGHPDVYIDSPDLRVLASGNPLPHVYSQDERRLCLYLPSSGQWNPEMLLTNTIVPWTSLWLIYFEAWLWSGEWQGGGEHPQSTDKINQESLKK